MKLPFFTSGTYVRAAVVREHAISQTCRRHSETTEFLTITFTYFARSTCSSCFGRTYLSHRFSLNYGWRGYDWLLVPEHLRILSQNLLVLPRSERHKWFMVCGIGQELRILFNFFNTRSLGHDLLYLMVINVVNWLIRLNSLSRRNTTTEQYWPRWSQSTVRSTCLSYLDVTLLMMMLILEQSLCRWFATSCAFISNATALLQQIPINVHWNVNFMSREFYEFSIKNAGFYGRSLKNFLHGTKKKSMKTTSDPVM